MDIMPQLIRYVDKTRLDKAKRERSFRKKVPKLRAGDIWHQSVAPPERPAGVTRGPLIGHVVALSLAGPRKLEVGC